MMNLYLVRYYEGGLSSFYLWEDDDQEGFPACFLIKKGKHYPTVNYPFVLQEINLQNILTMKMDWSMHMVEEVTWMRVVWDAIHVIEVAFVC